MPQTQDDPGSQSGLPIRLRGDGLMHQREEPVGVVLDLDVHIKLDMSVLRLQKFRWESSSNDEGKVECRQYVTYFHEDLNCFYKGWNGLFRFLDGPNMLHSVVSVPRPLFDLTWNRPEL